MFFRKLISYLDPAPFFRRDKEHESNINLRMMHGTNRLSIFMFLFCLIVMLVRALS
jgi:hypothetical protein